MEEVIIVNRSELGGRDSLAVAEDDDDGANAGQGGGEDGWNGQVWVGSNGQAFPIALVMATRARRIFQHLHHRAC